MDDERKEKYRNLMYSLQSIAYSVENTKSTLKNIKPALDTGILINGESVEQDVIGSVEKEVWVEEKVNRSP